jgi:hypothetical protein
MHSGIGVARTRSDLKCVLYVLLLYFRIKYPEADDMEWNAMGLTGMGREGGREACIDRAGKQGCTL